MKTSLAAVLLVLLAASTTRGAEEAPRIVFHLAGAVPAESARVGIVQLGIDLLKSSSFNTVDQAEILKQSVPQVQDRYRETLAGDYVLIRFAEPTKVKTLGAEVVVYDLVIRLSGAQYASDVFTVDDKGRVVAFEKYSGQVAIELKKAVVGK